MSRLFWKFFLAFWLTILLIAFTTSTIIWFQHKEDHSNELHLDRHAAVYISSAAAIAKHSELTTLRQFLSEIDALPFPILYAIDEQENDLLGRSIDPTLLSSIHKKHLEEGNQKTIKRITRKDGESLLLFAVRPNFNPFITSINELTPHGPPPVPANRPKLQPPQNSFGMPPPSPGGFNSQSPPPPPKGFGPPSPPPAPIYWLFIAIAASILFSGLLAWYFTRPIRDLHTAFSEVSNGNLTTRLSPQTLKRKDEFSELGHHFEQMVGKLQNLIGAQQNLLNDVSHELRSPLARMQAAVGIAQQQPDKVEITFNRLEVEIQQMSDLIGELLVLSQADTVDNFHEKHVIDFLSLLSEIVNDAVYEATEKQIKIDFKHDEGLELLGYDKLLRRAIENVIRNAIKFSPKNSTINVEAKKQHETIVLTVSDQGLGVKQQDLLSIFTPFFHSKEQNNNGSGLGLAIASRAIKKHGGSITAQNNLDQGLLITIKLPH